MDQKVVGEKNIVGTSSQSDLTSKGSRTNSADVALTSFGNQET